jgi:hypothetical protein
VLTSKLQRIKTFLHKCMVAHRFLNVFTRMRRIIHEAYLALTETYRLN